jgi:glycosyltransferase involved in cell wall biosynthesis
MKKVVFLLPGVGIVGGINVIFEHASRINRRGNFEVYIATPRKISYDEIKWHPEYENLKKIKFGIYDDFKDIYFDAAIATWWETVYYLDKINSKKYIYFNQSIESRFYSERDFITKKYADSTYFLNLDIITEATWIKNYLFNNYHIIAKLVKNGIRKDVYNLQGNCVSPRVKNRLRVLVEGSLELPLKNCERTLEICKQSKADEIWLLTTSEIKSHHCADRVFAQVPVKATAEIYRSCDVIVKLSYVEGMFGPPLEMFHCGGTAIVYDVSGHDEYIKHKYNALVVKTGDEKKVIESINILKDNELLLKKLKEGAIETANKWPDWEDSSMNFEKCLDEIIKQETNFNNQHSISFKINHFKEWYNYCNRYLEYLEHTRGELNAVYNSKKWRIAVKLEKIARKTGLIYVVKGMLKVYFFVKKTLKGK